MNFESPDLSTKLDANFFQQPARDIAQSLLGRTIVREFPNGTSQLTVIKEVAAWQGEEESSANTIRYRPGTLGVSTKRGHKLIDIGTGAATRPSCVTLIGLYSPDGIIQGPGNVSKYLRVDETFDNMSIDTDALWIGGWGISPQHTLQRKREAPKNCRGYFYFRE